MKRAVIYLRVSTSSRSKHGDKLAYDQDPALQEAPLRDLIAQRGGELVKVYSDRASGARESRPGLNQLLADARRGQLDVVVVWRFDRFARSVRQLVLAMEEFRSLGVDFVSHQEALDTSTPMGKVMFTIIAAMAELERSVIRERVVAGWSTPAATAASPASPWGVPGPSSAGIRWSSFARRACPGAGSPGNWA